MTPETGGVPLLRATDVHRSFGDVRALDGAELELERGEIHAVLGENGAGKTTLLRILAGFDAPDRGRIEMGGREVRAASPRDAWALGIGMVHQHFTLVPRLSVAENLALGRSGEGPLGLGLPLERVRCRARELSEEVGLGVDLGAPVESLGVGARQRVEILKVLLRDPRILILDEPTAVLAPPEIERLLTILRGLAGRGRTVVLVAHKLDEVLSVADRLTVLRRGRTVLEAARSEVDAPGLARAMVGSGSEELLDEVFTAGEGEGGFRPPPGPRGPVVARLRGVEVRGERGERALAGVDLEVRRGEIVGVAGVEGNGQRELALVLAGRLAPDAGTAELPDDPGFIPQDRSREGLVADFDLADNFALALHRSPSFRRGPFLRRRRVREATGRAMERFAVRAPGPGTLARALSGGNQQRMVVARELFRTPDLLVAENPTRGLDVTAEAFVHRQLRELVDREPAGTAAGRPDPPGVVLLSTDLDEVLELAHRVLVLVRGRLREVEEGRRSREEVGELMLGGREGAE